MEVDPNTGLKYILKAVDEKTKNHQDDTELITAFMPEFPNSELCPYKNFMLYLSKLHPRCNDLWQQVKDPKYLNDTDIWYKPRKIGPNPLSSYMSRISHSADLSKTYTNHSIRVTGTTLLGRCNYSSKQIMSVTGHRSVSSLAVYQKVSENEKLMMGMSMTCYLQSNELRGVQASASNQLPTIQQHPHPPPPIPRAIAPKPVQPLQPPVIQPVPAQGKEIVQYEPEDPLLKEDFAQDLNFDVNELLNNIEEEIAISQVANVTTVTTTTTTTYEKHLVKKSPQIPLFSNCKIGSIGNIHIHLHKE